MPPNVLQVARIRCRIAFAGAGRVSAFWGPTLRGGFGFALRRASCALNRPTCGDCPLGASCAYGYLFETPVPPGAPAMRKYPAAPRPFVFAPPEGEVADVRPGQEAALSFSLFGRGAMYLPYFLLALQELGRQGLGRDRVPFDVESLQGDGQALYCRSESPRVGRAALAEVPLDPQPPRKAVFTVEFASPARIRSGGALAQRPTLRDIVAALRRRAFLLSVFHQERTVELDAQRLFQAADAARLAGSDLRWEDHSRISGRQGRKVPIGGVAGRQTWEGDWGALGNLLKAGESVHLGKNASFGLGRIRVWAAP